MRGFLSFFLCLPLLLAGGCAGYRLGSTNGEVAGARSVRIEPILNRTLEPRLSEYLINSLRKNLQQDGTYRLETHGDGDVILSGTITQYARSGQSSLPNDVTTVLDYEIIVTAQLTAKERSTGRVIFDKAVTGHTTLRAGNDLTSAERQAIPQVTDDLAKKATSLLVDGTW